MVSGPVIPHEYHENLNGDSPLSPTSSFDQSPLRKPWPVKGVGSSFPCRDSSMCNIFDTVDGMVLRAPYFFAASPNRRNLLDISRKCVLYAPSPPFLFGFVLNFTASWCLSPPLFFHWTPVLYKSRNSFLANDPPSSRTRRSISTPQSGG